MARWLGFVVVLGLVMSLQGGGIDNAAHVGGAITGAVLAALWHRGYVYSPGPRYVIVGTCCLVLLAAVGIQVFRVATDRYASMTAATRLAASRQALDLGDCKEARGAFQAAARLYPRHKDVRVLESQIRSECGAFR